jgi:O-antigen/teichoic acid export membrane protein
MSPCHGEDRGFDPRLVRQYKLKLKKQSSLINIFTLFTSNLFKFLSSLIIVFILPNFFGVEDYGFYKFFLLCLSYVGFFHFGFIDGIYLQYGGRDLESLNQIKFRSYFYFFFIFQLLISIFLFCFSIFLFSGYRLIIFNFVILNLLPINITTYFQFISQITFRFNEYSKRLYLVSTLNLISVFIIIYFNLANFLFIILFSTVINLFLFFLYLFTYKSFIFGDRIRISFFLNEIIKIFLLGFPLLLSNFILIIFITLDKFFVEFFFDISAFSIYSFGFSILSLINLVVSSVSTVLYPVFKNIDKFILSQSYSGLNFFINLIVFFGLFIYFPLSFFLPIFLPAYIGSLSIIRIALPGLIFTSSITAITHNFYKVFNKNIEFLLIGFVAIFIFLFFIIISFTFQSNIENIAFSQLLALSFWYVLTHEFLKRKYNISYFKNLIYSLVFICVFLLLSSFKNVFLGSLLYLSFFTLFSVIEFESIKKAIAFIKY